MGDPMTERGITLGLTLEDLLPDEVWPGPSPEELGRRREAEWAEVRRLHRAALAAHPDRPW